MSDNIFVDMGADAAKGFVQSALRDWFAEEVTNKKIDPTTAAYIVEGEGDLASYLVKRFIGGK